MAFLGWLKPLAGLFGDYAAPIGVKDNDTGNIIPVRSVNSGELRVVSRDYVNAVAEGDIKDHTTILKNISMNTTSGSDQLMASGTVTEQSSGAQRSIASSSANDSSAGSGAQILCLEFIKGSDGLPATEYITMNGTGAVNTTSTDIKYIQNLWVCRGAAAAGTITLYSTTGGTGSTVITIPVGRMQQQNSTIYVPTGYSLYITNVGVSADTTCNVFVYGTRNASTYSVLFRYMDFYVASGRTIVGLSTLIRVPSDGKFQLWYNATTGSKPITAKIEGWLES